MVLKMFYGYYVIIILILYTYDSVLGYKHNIAWSGGPMHLECEHSAEMLTRAGEYRRENVIAIKAVTFNEEIYVLTPRLKSGIPASVWLIVEGRSGVELQAFPDLRTHTIAECAAIQNAIDLHLDHLGNVWILDSGIIETMERPRCVCSPKVVVVSILLKKPTRHIELSSVVEPASVLQSIVVDRGIARVFVYVSDAARGAILVHDTLSGSSWTVHAAAPGPGLQLALVRRGRAHTSLLVAQLHVRGLLELDTAALKRKTSFAPKTTYGEHSKPIILLGADLHHVYLRHPECSDVLCWDTRGPYNSSRLASVHSAGPRMTPTSVAPDHLKPVLIVLDSNYADTMRGNRETYHRITFVGKS